MFDQVFFFFFLDRRTQLLNLADSSVLFTVRRRIPGSRRVCVCLLHQLVSQWGQSKIFPVAPLFESVDRVAVYFFYFLFFSFVDEPIDVRKVFTQLAVEDLGLLFSSYFRFFLFLSPSTVPLLQFDRDISSIFISRTLAARRTVERAGINDTIMLSAYNTRDRITGRDFARRRQNYTGMPAGLLRIGERGTRLAELP